MTEQRTSDPRNGIERLANGGWRYTDEVYHQRWMASVMKRITVDALGCWRWKGFKGHTGYAQIGYRGQSLNGHRMMYIIHFGVKLVTEQYVLHRCDVRDCLNPDHLWIGTAKDNNADCARKGRHYEGSRSHCERGHPLSGENLYIARHNDSRHCRACQRIRMRIKAGWPTELAESLPVTPHGQRPVAGRKAA